MSRSGRPERFWPNVDRVNGGECWLWMGRLLRGYGRYGGAPAHRVAYEMEVGPIPHGLELDHLCRNKACVNPEHLEPVTRAENMRRRSAALTECTNGHPFTPENTYVTPSGWRSCRACNRAAAAAYRARRTAA